MRMTKFFFAICVLFLLSGCFGFKTVLSPNEFVSTPNIVTTDAGRIFVATEKGVFEVIDEIWTTTTRLVAEGVPGKGACSFFGLKAQGESLYAACVYTDNPPVAPLVAPLVPPLLGLLAPQPNYLSSALLHIVLEEDDTYTVRSGELSSTFLPRNLAILDDDTILVTSTERGMFGLDEGVSIYSTSFDVSGSTDVVQSLALSPWYERGVPHSLLYKDSELYLSSDSGISVRKYQLNNDGSLGDSSEVYKTDKLLTARVISNLSTFEGKLVITEESFTGPFLSKSRILIMNDDVTDVEHVISIPGNIVASNAALKRDMFGNIAAYVVSFYNGGVYRVISVPVDQSSI